LGPCGLSVVGESAPTTMLDRLRLSVDADLALLAGFSLGVSGAGAASSRARALVDRLGSDML
jgi:hypothetical protein